MPAPRIVLDTSVLVAALRSRRGASFRLLTLLGSNLFEAQVSIPLVLEYESVLTRQQSELGLSHEEVVRLVNAVVALSVRKRVHFLWRPFLRDPGDHHVLELAVAARCKYIVTHNLRDFAGIERFGLTPIGPREFLEQVGGLP